MMLLSTAVHAEPAAAPVETQDGDGNVVLPTVEQAIVGGGIQIAPKVATFRNWRTRESYLRWTVEIQKAGTYLLTLQYACDPAAAGTPIAIELGDAKMETTVTATSGWQDFQTIAVAKVKIASPMNLAVVIRALEAPKNGGVMDLRTVALQPTAE